MEINSFGYSLRGVEDGMDEGVGVNVLPKESLQMNWKQEYKTW